MDGQTEGIEINGLTKTSLTIIFLNQHIESLSDHAPILLTTGSTRPPCARRFKFELGWLHREGFHDMVKSVWERPVVGRSPIERWNNKIRSVRKHLGGWARHTTEIF
jgi:hypothetical protein